MVKHEKPYKIMIADDSVSVQKSVRGMLLENNDFNYSVIIANNGHEACTMAIHEQPDLVLLDIEMPVMSGIDAIKKIKGNNILKNTPIIVMSSTRQFQEAFKAGGDDFLIKPFTQYELLVRIQLNLQLAEKRLENKRQHELLNAQKLEAILQRDTILRQKTALTDDLDYARVVQKSLLPSPEVLNLNFESHFIYNRPKSIVSGDFYWIAQKNELTILAVGDCTGHGVSGALMTMAGAAFLNEIINYCDPISTDQILFYLRNRVIQLLNQKGEIGEVANGMDIAICIYNKNEQIMQFSGANNPIYIVRKGLPLEIIKGDRMPIGYYVQNNLPFTKHEMQISKGDIFYLFSDGYPDQFGGPNGQKFRYNQFQELLSKAALLPNMESQHELIKFIMDDWIDGYEQIDDMLILGVQI